MPRTSPTCSGGGPTPTSRSDHLSVAAVSGAREERVEVTHQVLEPFPQPRRVEREVPADAEHEEFVADDLDEGAAPRGECAIGDTVLQQATQQRIVGLGAPQK